MLLRIAVFFVGWIEFGFTLYAADEVGKTFFGLWTGFGCLVLMVAAIVVKEGK